VPGAGATPETAGRCETQFNENAAAPAFGAALPEADHTETCGYAPPLAAVFLDDPELDPRLRTRIDLTADLLRGGGTPVERTEARGDTPFERLMSLVLLGDLVSVYLAVLLGRDPTPVPAIDRLNAQPG